MASRKLTNHTRPGGKGRAMADRLEDYEQHASLMAAIVAAPDDDLPRLVYADWLDEIGRSEHAEWLRRELAESTTRIYPEDTAVFVQVCKNPLNKTSDFSDWFTDPDMVQFEIAPVIKGVYWETCRGFPSKAYCSTYDVVDDLENLKGRYPVELKKYTLNRYTVLDEFVELTDEMSQRSDADYADAVRYVMMSLAVPPGVFNAQR